MILIDFSSIVHRMIYSSISGAKPNKVDGKYVTGEFIGLTKYYIFQELFSIKQEYGNNFGELVVCLDKSSNGYWRKDVYPGYKASRKKGRDESEVNFGEVFAEIEVLITQLKENLPWKVIQVQKAEADDIMLVLAKEFNGTEKILIHSPDKDMIQAQRDNDNVFQYSSLTKKWIVPENKHDHMDHWIMEHVCLGDPGDDVPKIVDHTEFSSAFITYLSEKGYEITSPYEFKNSNIDTQTKIKLITEFDIYKLNRKGESTGERDIYKDIKFGPATLKKKISEFGSLDSFLDSHPLYRQHYERNFKLVMSEGIPSDIWNKIIVAFKQAKCIYNRKTFEEYLVQNNLKSILMDVPIVFRGYISAESSGLSADDFGW